MSDEPDDQTEKFRLNDEAFDRLPEHVKLATLLERERQQKKLAANTKHCAELGRRAGIISFVIFLSLHAYFVHNIPALVLISLAGGGAGYYIISSNRSHIIAMLIFGAVAIVGDMLAYAAGVVDANEMTFAFFVWLVLQAAAFMMVNWARKQREDPGNRRL